MCFCGWSNAERRLYEHSRAKGTDGINNTQTCKYELIGVVGFGTQAKAHLSEQVLGESVLPGHGKHEAGWGARIEASGIQV